MKTGYPSIDKPWLKYYSEEVINSPLPESSIYEIIRERNHDNLRRVAIDYYGKRITYKDLFDHIDSVSDSLAKLGIKRGDIVSICMLNSPETIYLIYALNKIGAVANLISGLDSDKEIIEHIGNATSPILFTLDIFKTRILSIIDKTNGLSPVIPTNDLSLLPSFHNGKAKIVQGRAITKEEYESGEKVCLVSDAFLNDLYYYYIGIGTEISLPLLCSLYNYDGGKQVESTGNYRTSPFLRRYSLLNADGAPYSPFANDKYTVVGFYSIDPKEQEAGRTELMVDTVIIPAKSVTASDENNIAYYAPMNAKSTSFRIPNGTIEEFDRKLHEAVLEAEGLTINYYDNGYTEVMGDLNRAKSTAALLLFAGLGSTLAIVTLLLYFFVVREKKRTAIERSLGMTKGQCAVSLLSGLLVLALLAVCLGAALGGISVEHMGNGEAVESEFNLMFSDWQDVSAEAGETGAVSLWLCLAAPFAVWLAVLVLGLFLLGRNLKIEPIYLLSGKLEDS